MNNAGIELCGTQHVYASQLIKHKLAENRQALLGKDKHNGLCYDGIVDEKAYSAQEYKLAFLLKETNGNKPDGAAPDAYEDWDYVAWIRERQSTGSEPLYPTFRNIAMWSSEFFDIFEKGKTNKSDYLQNGVLQINDSLRESLKRIAVINLKKTFGGGTTSWKALDQYLTSDICDIVREEIHIAEPTVILCGGQQVFDFVFKLYHTDAGECPTFITPKEKVIPYIPVGNMKYVNFYHPACRKSREGMYEYASDVFEGLKQII